MQETCTLSFAIRPLSDDEPVRSILPIVNDVPLTNLVEEFERGRRYEPVGGYAGIVPTHFNLGPVDKYYMGFNSPLPNGRWYLLGCECGEVGCWPLEVRIRTNEEEIVWEGFRQPFRPERDYTSFGPFRFDLNQYRLAVTNLAASFLKSSVPRE
jgi:hypothetical protein